jgi:predicted dehydrogenase
MAARRLGVILNGISGRIGVNQHLRWAIGPILAEGGVALSDGTRVELDPILVGRDEARLAALAKRFNVARWSTDLDAALGDPHDSVFFDATPTDQRVANVRRALEAGKHVYIEKPTATNAAEAVALYHAARDAGVRHGVVQNYLWLPGILKLRRLIDSGFFGRVLAIKIDFGYWIFEGDWQRGQRPSWNYRKEDGGGIVLDLMPHWRYVTCLALTQVAERWDEQGEPYRATADDGAFATILLADDAVVHVSNSWCTRIRRDDLSVIQVDGTYGSAVTGLYDCLIQPRAATPAPVFNPDPGNRPDFLADWRPVPDNQAFESAFKVQWQLFVRHVVEDARFPYDLRAGAKGVQLAELAYKSSAERRWIDVPEIPE